MKRATALAPHTWLPSLTTSPLLCLALPNSDSIRLCSGSSKIVDAEQRNESPGVSPCRQSYDESRELLCPQFGSDGMRAGGKTQRGRWLSTREREKCREFVAENRVGGSSPVAGSPLQLLLVIPNLRHPLPRNKKVDGSHVARFLYPSPIFEWYVVRSGLTLQCSSNLKWVAT